MQITDKKSLNLYETLDSMIDIENTNLTKREREVIHLYFYEGMTEREVAESLGISQQRVSFLKRKALHKLRELLA